jgi:hypothetical protein
METADQIGNSVNPPSRQPTPEDQLNPKRQAARWIEAKRSPHT